MAPCLLSFTSTATTGPLGLKREEEEEEGPSVVWATANLLSSRSISTSVPVATEKGRGE